MSHSRQSVALGVVAMSPMSLTLRRGLRGSLQAAILLLGLGVIGASPAGAQTFTLPIGGAILGGGANFTAGGDKIKFDPNTPGETALFSFPSVPGETITIF